MLGWGMQSTKRRRSGSNHFVQNVEESLNYEAPSSLSSAFAFTGVLRDVDVEVEVSATNSTSDAEEVAPSEGAVVVQQDSFLSSPSSSVVSGGGNDNDDDDDECALCLGGLSEKAAATIQACKHTFHDCCIRDWLGRQPRCPFCQLAVGVAPQGTSPSGTMTIQLSSGTSCPGFSPDTTCIEIIYHIPAGTQHSFHENPGTRYWETTRRAYLPNNEEGRHLLTRFKKAFAQGLTFTIGTSLTTSAHNMVVWTQSYDHKTSLFGGVFGFPNPCYIATCNSQLDALGIPHGVLLGHDVQDYEVVSYNAPQVLGPPSLLPDVLQLVERAHRATKVNDESQHSEGSPTTADLHTAAGAGASNISPPLLLPLSRPKRSVSNSSSPHGSVPDLECPICFEALSQRAAAQIKVCNHVFHQDCIHTSLSHEARCPVCRKYVREPQGRCPSGTLSIRLLNDKICPGFNKAKAIELIYTIPSGIQKPYHDHPGTPCAGTRRVAYLPNNAEGCCLLTRLRYAWNHGLTFTVGTSLTSGRSDVVTWTSIPHKTVLDASYSRTRASSSSSFGDPHGFPDPQYLTNCNNALDALGVPNADTCLVQPQSVLIDC